MGNESRIETVPPPRQLVRRKNSGSRVLKTCSICDSVMKELSFNHRNDVFIIHYRVFVLDGRLEKLI